MRNDGINIRNIFLVKNDIEDDMIFKSELYKSNIIIKEIYCTDPRCQCRDVTLVFFGIYEINGKGKEIFSIMLNIDTLKVSHKIITDKSVNVDEIIDELFGEFSDEIRNRVNIGYRISKGIDDGNILKPITQEIKDLALSGNCIGFNEIFDNAEQITFRDEKSDLIYIDDQYCMNPKCPCNEVYLNFFKINELDNSGDIFFTLRYRLKNGKYDIEDKSCTEEYMKNILKSFKIEERLIMEKLKKKYKDMKVVGKQIYDENKINNEPFIAAIQVGRNDLCPCGSGKKYKRCCGK